MLKVYSSKLTEAQRYDQNFVRVVKYYLSQITPNPSPEHINEILEIIRSNNELDRPLREEQIKHIVHEWAQQNPDNKCQGCGTGLGSQDPQRNYCQQCNLGRLG